MVDVVIPTYKVFEHNLIEILEEQINYFQSHDIVKKVILVSDWPSDNLSLGKLSLRYSKVTFIPTSKNVGQAKARNVGFSQTTSLYVVFLDQDDSLTFGDENWDTDVVFFSTFMESKGVVKKYFSTVMPFLIARVESISELYPLMLTSIRFSPGSFAVKRSLFEFIGGFPELQNRGSDDYGLLVRTMILNVSISYCDVTKFVYHIHKNQSRNYLDLNLSIKEYLACDYEVLPLNLRSIIKFRLTLIGSFLGKVISKIITI